MRASILVGALAVAIVSGCGGDKKKAKDPTDEGPPPSSKDETPKWEGASRVTDTGSSSSSGGSSGSSGAGKSSGGGGGHVNEAPKQRTDVPDKEATDIPLKRAARQVKDNCGQAKDDSGKATGPWGKVTLQIMLGHNGHSKEVIVPPPFAEKAVGRCIEKAFTNLTFPPWAGADTQVTQEVELVEPGKEKK